MDIKYNPRIIPNGEEHDIINNGANCQVYAYNLLRHNNLFVPDLRSSELWTDTEYSTLITGNYQALDILFFHKKNDAYGAHLAIFLGDNKAIHNAKKIGLPIIWDIDTFFQYPVYQFLLGGKRFFKEG
ncbi:MAG: lipoprotein Spr [Maribacter sp.]|jgi:lipoprotein Spr